MPYPRRPSDMTAQELARAIRSKTTELDQEIPATWQFAMARQVLSTLEILTSELLTRPLAHQERLLDVPSSRHPME